MAIQLFCNCNDEHVSGAYLAGEIQYPTDIDFECPYCNLYPWYYSVPGAEDNG